MPLEPLVGRSTAVTDDLRRMHVHALVLAAMLVAIEAVGLAAGWSLITRGARDWPQIYPYTVGGLDAVTQRAIGELTGAQVADLVIRLIGRGREGISIDLAVASVRDSNDTVGYLVLQCTDLTDRKRLERGMAGEATPTT